MSAPGQPDKSAGAGACHTLLVLRDASGLGWRGSRPITVWTESVATVIH